MSPEQQAELDRIAVTASSAGAAFTTEALPRGIVVVRILWPSLGVTAINTHQVIAVLPDGSRL